MTTFIWRASSIAVAVIIFLVPAASARDRHDGYYYPTPYSIETYKARARILPDSDRDRRLGFIVGFTKQLSEDPSPMRFTVFAKGTEAEKLIIVALDDDIFASLFRARAVLATLTAHVRASPLFGDLGVQNLFTFYDLAKMLGFKQITVSDGREWSHRVDLK
ncbi:MAG: hypothetical protein CFH41_02024 [Alphaproteobacteria bacterium MarineAlpha11_Bin1]|nr:MAG: hypothetical protein CFH41_02024 [Alphaproteobacteria bacterium MarineAlpha11_Bin1]|tara:strand:- start:4725 stop:5210 length:486 start_codon:yes stop_codon:yes gene_type:complete